MKPSFVSRYLFFNIRKDIYFLILIFKIKFYSILYTLSFDSHSISGSCNLGYRIFFYLFFFEMEKIVEVMVRVNINQVYRYTNSYGTMYKITQRNEIVIPFIQFELP